MIFATTQDPFQSFDAQDFNKHHGPPVPEPRVYGVIFVGIILTLVAWRKWNNKH